MKKLQLPVARTLGDVFGLDDIPSRGRRRSRAAPRGPCAEIRPLALRLSRRRAGRRRSQLVGFVDAIKVDAVASQPLFRLSSSARKTTSHPRTRVGREAAGGALAWARASNRFLRAGAWAEHAAQRQTVRHRREGGSARRSGNADLGHDGDIGDAREYVANDILRLSMPIGRGRVEMAEFRSS